MERLKKDITNYLSPVRLYLDDLEHLFSLLSEDMDVEIRTKQFKFESLDDLKANTASGALNKLAFHASTGHKRDKPYLSLSVDIEPDQVIVHASHALAERCAFVTQLLRSRSPWYSWSTPGALWDGLLRMLSMLVLALVIAFAIQIVSPFAVERTRWIALAVTPILFVVLFAGKDVWIGGSRIYLFSKVGRPSFWHRNRDAILVRVVAGTILILVGFVLGRLSG